MIFSIKWAVILGCVLLVWMTQAIIMPFSEVSSRNVMLSHSRDIMANVLTLTHEETRNYFERAQGAARLTKRLISSDVVSTNQNEIDKLNRYLYEKLDLHHQIAGIYFASPSGNFYYAAREPDHRNGAYRFKSIVYDEDGKRETRLTWWDKDKNTLAVTNAVDDNFDPRKRPWYIKAVKEKEIIWTDPYLFYTSKKPGITSAGPLYDENGILQGVVGVDIELDVLSDFIGKLKVGKTGKAFIVHENKEIIAFPDVALLNVQGPEKNETMRLPTIEELDDPLCNLAFKAVKKELFDSKKTPPGASVFAHFQHQGKTYFTMFTYVLSDRCSWMIGVYLPQEDYLAGIHENRRHVLQLTLVASAIATVLGLWAAGRLIRPIVALEREADKIKACDYSVGPEIRTRLRELQNTLTSFIEMKTAVAVYKQRIREKDSICRAITEAANEAIIMVDKEGSVTYWNTSAQIMFGFTETEALNTHIFNLFELEQQLLGKNIPLHNIFENWDGISPLNSAEIDICTRTGRKIVAEMSLVKVVLEQRPCAIAIFRDISDRKKREKEIEVLFTQLQESHKTEAIATLAGGFAHDFNNILFAIMGYAELLKFSCAEDQKSDEYINKLLTACERARKRVREILSFSFQRNGELSLISMPSAIRSVCEDLTPSLPESVVIRQEIGDGCPLVSCNPEQIREVLKGIVLNGVQAMEDTGGLLVIKIAVMEFCPGDTVCTESQPYDPGSYLHLSVKDTGPGIPPQIMDKIYNPYFTTRPHGKGGGGLGLAVIKAIVQNHGGIIYFDSNLGQGTECHIFLPVSQTSLTPPGIFQARHLVQKGNEHILLVDQKAISESIEKRGLEMLGYQVTTRLTGKDAIAAVEATPARFDIVLAHSNLPDITGKQLSEALSKIPPLRPVILFANYEEMPEPRNKKKKGTGCLLSRPVHLVKISNILRQHLDDRLHYSTLN